MLDRDHLTAANTWALTFAQIETAEAVANLDEILAVDWLDGVLLGPNDLAISMRGDKEISAPEVLEVIEDVRARANAANKLTWAYANNAAFAETLVETGWKFVAIGSDIGWLRDGASAARTMK